MHAPSFRKIDMQVFKSLKKKSNSRFKKKDINTSYNLSAKAFILQKKHLIR
jgi:hypothetical protein